MPGCRIATIGLLIVSLTPGAVGADEMESTGTVDDACVSLRDATMRRDFEALERTAGDLAAIGDDDPQIALARYYLGLARFRQAQIRLDDGERKQARKLLERAAEAIEESLDAEPSSSEAYALLGITYASQVRARPSKSVYWKPKAERTLERAVELDAANPRAWLGRGIVHYFSAAQVKKELAESLRLLDRSVELFELQESSAPLAPRWGHDEAYGYMAMIHMDLGKVVEARVALERAGFVNPDNRWITNHLQERLTRVLLSGKPD